MRHNIWYNHADSGEGEFPALGGENGKLQLLHNQQGTDNKKQAGRQRTDKAKFKKYAQIPYSKHVTADVVANWIMKQNGVTNVRIERVSGALTDHYDPTQKVLRLSDCVYGSSSIAAIGVAAHECGHAIQDDQNYQPLVLRRKMVPITNIGSKAAFPIILIGMLLGFTGLYKVGVLRFSVVVLFQLVTLPVEFDASKRACLIMASSNRFSADEMHAVKKVLTAAAMTYLATALNAIIQLLRLIFVANRRQ